MRPGRRARMGEGCREGGGGPCRGTEGARRLGGGGGGGGSWGGGRQEQSPAWGCVNPEAPDANDEIKMSSKLNAGSIRRLGAYNGKWD